MNHGLPDEELLRFGQVFLQRNGRVHRLCGIDVPPLVYAAVRAELKRLTKAQEGSGEIAAATIEDDESALLRKIAADVDRLKQVLIPLSVAVPSSWSD